MAGTCLLLYAGKICHGPARTTIHRAAASKTRNGLPIEDRGPENILIAQQLRRMSHDVPATVKQLKNPKTGNPMKQAELYERFLALHGQDGGFIMPNAWDCGSALILKNAGFKALGTSSAALAAALGRLDGRHGVTRQEHLEHASLLTKISGLPVNGDFEDGYGANPSDVADTVEAAIAAGLAGIGIEDTSGNPDKPIRDFDDAVARMKAAAKAAKGRIVLTGRSDNFIQGRPDLEDTIKRLQAFAEAGADVLYAPYPADMDAVRAIVKAVAPKPVNLLVGTMAGTVPWAELKKAGVKRVSLGANLYMRAMGDLQKAAAELVSGDLARASAGMSFGEISRLIREATS
jgi:2-methylisocitrate lyase-like PEP mutase family enzyme